jgi:DNA-binding transcriptional regulator YiaG
MLHQKNVAVIFAQSLSPLFERNIRPEDLITFRESLGMTTREFGKVFEFSQPSLNALERGRTSGKDILKRLEILINFPAVALDFLVLNSGYLVHDKWIAAAEQLKKSGKKQDGKEAAHVSVIQNVAPTPAKIIQPS